LAKDKLFGDVSWRLVRLCSYLFEPIHFGGFVSLPRRTFSARSWSVRGLVDSIGEAKLEAFSRSLRFGHVQERDGFVDQRGQEDRRVRERRGRWGDARGLHAAATRCNWNGGMRRLCPSTSLKPDPRLRLSSFSSSSST